MFIHGFCAWCEQQLSSSPDWAALLPIIRLYFRSRIFASISVSDCHRNALQLRQGNFGAYGDQTAELRPPFKGPRRSSFLSPPLDTVAMGDQETTDFLKDPGRPVLCLQDIFPSQQAYACQTEPECTYGSLGSAVNFWKASQKADRISMGFKMPTNAAFNSMTNKDGIIVVGRTQARGHHDGTPRRG